jgi:hypothetical protein
MPESGSQQADDLLLDAGAVAMVLLRAALTLHPEPVT